MSKSLCPNCKEKHLEHCDLTDHYICKVCWWMYIWDNVQKKLIPVPGETL